MTVEQEVREDFRTVFGEISELQQSRAAQTEINRELNEDIAGLKTDIEKLTAAVTALTSAIDKSRGALYVISAASGIAGAIAAAVVRAFVTSKPGG